MTRSLDLDQALARRQPGDPIDPIDDKDVECLGGVALSSMTATPSSVRPFGGGATLRWSATVPAGCAVAILLNGRSVSRSGSMTVAPAVTTRYTLTARAGRATRTLGGVTVIVDTSACITAAVPESLVRAEVRGVVDRLDAASSRFRQRSAPSVEVDGGGIRVALRLRVAIDNFADPDVDVDFTVGLRVRNGSVDPFFGRFAVDVDWPWWVTAVTAGVSKIVEEFLDGQIEGALKPAILEQLKAQLDGFVDRLPGELRLHAVALSDGEIRVTACPAGEDTPFMVLPGALDRSEG